MHRAEGGDAAAEAAAGLLRTPAAVPPEFFCDAQGSRLFDAITELAEYDPIRTEAGILAAHGAAIADAVRACTGAHPVIVDFGAGNCAKGAALFPLLTPRRCVALDISAEHVAQALAQLQCEHPALDLAGVGLDFSSRLALPSDLAGGGTLLIGVDLVKAVDVLEAAYDDALGVTAAFDLNLLREAGFEAPRHWCDEREWIEVFVTAA